MIPIDRKQRLESITAHLKKHHDFPLLKSIPLNSILMERLKVAVNFYLWVTLSNYYPDKIFDFTKDLLKSYPEEIIGLPNITPNGSFLPKKENQLAYNEVHKIVSIIFKFLNLKKFVDLIQSPVHIRIVNGDPDKIIKERPYSSTKPHSDIWFGEPAKSIMVFIALLGDLTSSNVRFTEPEIFPKNFMKKLHDYNDGKEITKTGIVYDAQLKFGCIFLADPMLIHQTLKLNSGLRLSIDFRFVPKQELKSDYYNGKGLLKHFIPLDEWDKFGANRLITTSDQLEPFIDKKQNNKGYSADYKIIKI